MSRRNIRERERPGPTGWNALALLRTGRRKKRSPDTPSGRSKTDWIDVAHRYSPTRGVGGRMPGSPRWGRAAAPSHSDSRLPLAVGRSSLVVYRTEARGVVAVADRPLGLLVEQRRFAPPSFDLHDHRLIDADHFAAIGASQRAAHKTMLGPTSHDCQAWIAPDSRRKLRARRLTKMGPATWVKRPGPLAPGVSRLHGAAAAYRPRQTAARLMATRAAHRRAGVPSMKPLLRGPAVHLSDSDRAARLQAEGEVTVPTTTTRAPRLRPVR